MELNADQIHSRPEIIIISLQEGKTEEEEEGKCASCARCLWNPFD